MNNLKKSIEKNYKDVQDLMLLENYNEAVELMYNIVQKLVASQMDDACLVSKGFDKDLDILYGANIIEKGTLDNYKGIVSLYEMISENKKPPVDTIKLGASILQNEIDYAIRRTIIPTQDEANSGSYEGNIDFPLSEDENNGNDVIENEQNNSQIDYVKEAQRRMEEARAELQNNNYANANQPQFNNQAYYQNQMFNQNQMNYENQNYYQQQGDMFSQNIQDNQSNGSFNFSFSLPMLIKIIVPVACLVVIVLIIKSILPSKPKEVNNIETTIDLELENSMRELESLMETSEESNEPEIYVVTGDAVKLRYEPSTSSRVYLSVNKNIELKLIKFYDDDWALVEYDGHNLYISRRYIQKQ